MAISKTQNERPAIVALIDEVNATSATVAQQQQQIYDNANAIAGEIETRSNAIDGLTRSLGATNQQILLLTQDVDALESAQPAINDLLQRIKIGETENITIPANDSYSSSYVFSEPFADGDGCMVILQVVTDELSTLFDATLIDCTYSGFSYQVTNSDADPHDVKLGFVAFKTNGN